MVTNERHNMDPFWTSGFTYMNALNIAAFTYGTQQKVSYEVSTSTKIKALFSSLFVMLDITDDFGFLFMAQHDS